MSYVKIGVAGPVGSGKTALIECLTRQMASEYSIGVITNDIYTKEDAEFLSKNSVLPRERITGVETGGCPHTATREHASMNLEAVEEMMEKFPDIQLLFILISLAAAARKSRHTQDSYQYKTQKPSKHAMLKYTILLHINLFLQNISDFLFRTKKLRH